MFSKKITVIDYGLGNLFSIERAVNHFGGEPEITGDPQRIASAERLILPGVGAFSKGMEELNVKGIADAVYEFARKDRPLMGICLGMQLLMTRSYEFGVHDGLNLIGGEVIRFQESNNGGPSFKIPHVGWAKIRPFQSEDINAPAISSWSNTALKGIESESFFYFVHSYFVAPDDRNHTLAESEYADNTFCAAIKKDNLFGCQFHPEKSGPVGLRLLENFSRN